MILYTYTYILTHMCVCTHTYTYWWELSLMQPKLQLVSLLANKTHLSLSPTPLSLHSPRPCFSSWSCPLLIKAHCSLSPTTSLCLRPCSYSWSLPLQIKDHPLFLLSPKCYLRPDQLREVAAPFFFSFSRPATLLIKILDMR
jgi:hypothetical protein